MVSGMCTIFTTALVFSFLLLTVQMADGIERLLLELQTRSSIPGLVTPMI